MQPNSNLDVVYVVISILTVLFGPSMAAIVGPFAVIVLSAVGGAAWSVGRRPSALRTIGSDVFFFGRLAITAVMVTGGIAVFVERWTGAGTRQWTLPVIALLIGAIGDDWPGVGRWFAGAVRRWASRRPDSENNH
jgi:hypothetical protein